MNDKEIKVTGTRNFQSGAKRDPNTDKGRYDLLSPLFLKRLAVHTQKGGVARGDRNWEAGMPMSAVLDSAIRHCFTYLEGDRSEDHLAAAAWNLMNLIHTEEQIERGNLPASLAEGLPDYTKKETVQDEEMEKDWQTAVEELFKSGVLFSKLIPEIIEDVYPNEIIPYDGPKPHEHYDDPKYFVTSKQDDRDDVQVSDDA
jgi:hypothetical protein